MHLSAFAIPTVVIVTVATAAGIHAIRVSPPERSGPIAADAPVTEQRVLGIHHLTLKSGVQPADFERFVAEEWNPVMNGRFPGIHWMVMKGERNSQGSDYLLVYDIQSAYVRDWYWPSSTEETQASQAVWDACATCDAVSERFASMVEVTRWTDFVQVGGS